MKPTASSRPFLLLAPESLSAIVLTCEHATNELPFSRGVGPAQRRVLATHWGFDIGAWAVTAELARRLDLGAIGGRWSRLLIDLNRHPGDPTLVRRKAGTTVLPWSEDLDAAELERRLAKYHAPYHAELDRLIVRRLVRGVRPLLVALHSFTPRLGREARPFEIGVLYNHDGAPARRLGRALSRAGFSVRYNEPYSGLRGMMYAVERHGAHHGLPCLELELNQRLFRHRHTASKLAARIAPALAALAPPAELVK